MDRPDITIRAIQLGERIELKGLEREDTFSKNPLAYRTPSGGIVALFKTGAVVFIAMTPPEEEAMIPSIMPRVAGALTERESETAHVLVRGQSDDLVTSSGMIQLRTTDDNRLLLVAEALAMSVAMAYDERRIAKAFERIAPVAQSLSARRLPAGSQSNYLEQIGEALTIQQRLADRVDLDDKPDVLWDHPELERLWIKLVDEYDLPARGRAIGRKLEVIQETSDTMTELLATRTSHRLEWYIIVLIAIEILLGLYDRFWK
ncbi:MAG: RMD1 family protein [Hyphomicrobiaceae bacterium]|nr:RMD1 family protein [Hyphomicrobiaceae bacterium]